MLVMRRHASEKITLASPTWDTDITVTICTIEGNRVKLGIEAPRSVIVARSELLPWQPVIRAEQGESGQEKTWFVADREQAYIRAPLQTKDYIRDLENIARLADAFWTAMAPKAMSPEQNQLSDELLNALSKVNFLAEQDQANEEELTRSVIWK